MSEPVFLELEDVLLLHEQQLARYGGGAGIRDLGLLESAVATPRATFGGEYLHAGLFEMAAAYAFHMGVATLSWTHAASFSNFADKSWLAKSG